MQFLKQGRHQEWETQTLIDWLRKARTFLQRPMIATQLRIVTRYDFSRSRTSNEQSGDLIIELKTTQPPPDLEVLFVVRKGSSSYYSRSEVRRALSSKASSVAASMGMKLIDIQVWQLTQFSSFWLFHNSDIVPSESQKKSCFSSSNLNWIWTLIDLCSKPGSEHALNLLNFLELCSKDHSLE